MQSGDVWAAGEALFEGVVMAETAVAALETDLAEIGKRDPALAGSALAATARQLARELDKPKNSATSKAMCSKALMDALDRLRELAPAEQRKDALDELAKKREARLAV